MDRSEAEFNNAIGNFLLGCTAISNRYMDAQFPTLAKPTLSITRGKRYARIVREDAAQKSVHCFVDMTNGDVLKAAGWKAPAKHARGNIFDEHNGLGTMGEYGPAYLR